MLKIITFMLALLLTIPAHAEDMIIYEAEVEVDAVADNAALAREKALTEANRKALYAVVNRISMADSTKILDELNENQILNFIQEVTVISEKVVDARYIASLKITINAPIIKTYLAEKDAPITILPETHIFIIPVLKNSETSAPLLWENNNLWYQTWAQNTMESGQITMQPLPATDTNKTLLSPEDALRLNQMSLNALSKNNKGYVFYIAEATLNGNSLLTTLKSPTAGIIKTKTYNQGTQDFENAVQDIKAVIMEQLQQQAANQEHQQNKLTIVYNFNALKDWLEFRRVLENFSPIKNLDIDAMSGRRAQITISFTGSQDDLEKELRKYGFSLADSGNFHIAERI